MDLDPRYLGQQRLKRRMQEDADNSGGLTARRQADDAQTIADSFRLIRQEDHVGNSQQYKQIHEDDN